MLNDNSLNGGWMFVSDLPQVTCVATDDLKAVFGSADPSLIPSAMEQYMARHSSSPDDPAHSSALRLMQHMCVHAYITDPEALLQYRDYFAEHLASVAQETGLEQMEDIAVSMRTAQSCERLLYLISNQIDMQLAFWDDLKEAEVLLRNLEVTCRYMKLQDDIELQDLSLDIAEKLHD